MPRKTIEVAYVRDLVNTALATPDSTLYVGDPTREMTPEQAFRTGVASVLEQILHATDNYRGFQYQESEFNPPDDQPRYGVLREGYDGTRRRYL